VRTAVEQTGVTVASAQTVGRAGTTPNYLIRTPKLADEQRENTLAAISRAGKVNRTDIAASEVSSSWGGAVTNRALLGLGVFLVVVALYLWLRFERHMAIAAIGALLHDLVLTAGVYSVSGFEVTPATVIGLLTILGFSLYDTVVVFDKVQENTRGLLGSTRMTYPEAANAAVNQTLMRSINTSIIALLPVAALLFVGAGLLGVGTLKDLALVLFVGLATGAYSSIFLATPWLVELKLTDDKYKLHTQRVLTGRAKVQGRPETSRRRVPATSGSRSGAGSAGGTGAGTGDDAGTADGEAVPDDAAMGSAAETDASAPTVARPVRPVSKPRSNRPAARKRQGGKRR
jgi:preprotein translocase subunit SecF